MPFLAYTSGSYYKSSATLQVVDSALTAAFRNFMATNATQAGTAYPVLHGIGSNLFGTPFIYGHAGDPVWTITGTFNSACNILSTSGFHAPSTLPNAITGTSDSPYCIIDLANGFTILLTQVSNAGGNVLNVGSAGITYHTSNGLDGRSDSSLPGYDSRNFTSRGRISDAQVIRKELVDYGIANNTDLGHVLHMFFVQPDSTQGFQVPMVGNESPRNGWGAEGQRLAIDASIDLTERGLSPAGLVIARTLQRHGCYIGDTAGGVTTLKAEQETPSHPVWGTELNQNSLSGITWNDFVALDSTNGRFPPVTPPIVIGTLSSSTPQTTYDVPITATTIQGDYLVLGVGSAGSDIPSSITDTQLQENYTNVPGATAQGPGELSVWALPNSAILTNDDTINVTFPSANSSLKNIIVLDCPGALILDNAAVANNSGTVTTNGQPTISAGTSVPIELILFFEQNANAGGAPTFSVPFVPITTLQSGSSEYTSVAYQVIQSSSGAFTGNATVTTDAWATSSIGLQYVIPTYVPQQPFTDQPPSLAFNPAIQFKPPPPQPPIVTVIPSAPVNITGAQSNVFVPGVNFLQGDSTNFNSTVGSWVSGGSTTVAHTNTFSHNALGALTLTATTTGTISAVSSAGAKVSFNALPCKPGDTIFAACWVLADSVGRTASIGITGLDTSGSTTGPTVFGSSVTDNTAVWQLITVTAQVPSAASTAYSRANVQFASPLVINEIHYVSDVWLFNISQSSGMGELVQVLQRENRQFLLSPNGLPNPLNLNPAYFGLRRQVRTAVPTVFQPGAAASVNVSAGAGLPTYIVASSSPFPFPPVTPLSLQINPSLSWLQPQHSTANPTTFIDGGISGQNAVNAQYPDISAVVSVTADPPPNISVAANPPSTIVQGGVAVVTVTSPSGSSTVIRTNIVANVNAAAVAGTTKNSIIGAVANVNVVAVAGVATVIPVGVPAQVNVAAPNGSIKEAIIGAAGNVNVASTGVAVVTPQGVSANVNTQALAGAPAYGVVGQVSNISIASTGGAADSVPGITANVSVTAIPGIPGKTALGVTANITVTATVSTQIVLTGVAQNISVSAAAGSISKSIQGVTANVNVTAPSGQSGSIEILATLANPDLAEDIILSRQGKLLDVPVSNMLVSADEI